MKQILFFISVLAFLAGVFSLSWAQEAPSPLKTASSGELGEILTGPKEMTLYIFALDREPGESACNGACARNWPPFQPASDAPAPEGPLSVITREDGTEQYAYQGRPLYYWSRDKKPGDTNGHNLGGVWAVATP